MIDIDRKSAEVGWKYFAGDNVHGKFFESAVVGSQLFRVEDEISLLKGYSTSIVAGERFKDPISVKFSIPNPYAYEYFASVLIKEMGGEDP